MADGKNLKIQKTVRNFLTVFALQLAFENIKQRFQSFY